MSLLKSYRRTDQEPDTQKVDGERVPYVGLYLDRLGVAQSPWCRCQQPDKHRGAGPICLGTVAHTLLPQAHGE
eukprot:CAMPEP_0204354936 /NCGR_PEP_ID=MMETSP0469-20131031/33772_1 /ASSEMBLY_ACC=CAM_ASM_000384 /TAXON_ID=2969 /ORGANISM="Oxyrrhis marina" /LENGTH=72 /DNA_ID=CAMNT_0051342109 /DNA_START=370 /DNA_END=585 /DNA_ORIENTATION=+